MSEKGTEQATEQRKQKARDKGDLVRSRDLLSAVAMLAGVFAIGVGARQFVTLWAAVYTNSLLLGSSDLQSGIGSQLLLQRGMKVIMPALGPAALVLVAAFSAALAIGIGQTGRLDLHSEALAWKFERLNPAKNLQHILSLRSVIRMGKSLVPATVVVALGVKVINKQILPIPVMRGVRLPMTFEACFNLMIDAGWVTAAWAALDYAIEWRAWNRKLRMTKQELRDEMRDTMGNPQVKGRIRRIQHAMRRRKVNCDVSKASVIITNPTHYAVALAFSFETMQAPTVLIKGRNLHAQRIREEARWAGVPIVENPPLARSLYKEVEEGHSIPFALYSAVAGILAYLYRQQVENAARDQAAVERRRARAKVWEDFNGLKGTR